MHHIGSEAVKIAETDGAGAQSEPFFKTRFNFYHCRVQGNSPRRIDSDALTPNVSGEFKGVDSLSQPGKNGGPWKSNVQSITAPHLQVPVEVAAAATIRYWLALWYWLTPWMKKSKEWRKETTKFEMAEEILNIIGMSKVNAVRTLRCMDIHSPMALALIT